jgi:hypothetical protein
MKTIITLDRANQPYGYPQLDGSGNITTTGSLNVSGSINLNGVDINSLMIAYSIALG